MFFQCTDFNANQATDIKPIQQVMGVVIFPSVRPVCQLLFFGLIPLCGVTAHMHAHATLSELLYSESQTALGLWVYVCCYLNYVLKLSTGTPHFFLSIFCILTLLTGHVKTGGFGKMSCRSDVSAIYSIWHKLYSSIDC